MIRASAALDALNFLLADVRGSLGPYVNVYLVTDHGWSQTAVGLMNMWAGLTGVLFQTPVGASIDTTRHRRAAIGIALGLLAAGVLVIWASHAFWPVALASAGIALVGDVFAPSIAALSAGLVARAALTRRLGRNAAFDHAGNIAIGLLIGVVATEFSKRSVFLLVPAFAVLAIAVTFTIPARAIDNRRARGFDRGDDPAEADGDDRPSGMGIILRCRPLLVFAASVALFHLANAAMLPLVSQELADGHPRMADGMVSTCIVGAQAVMLPVAILVGRKADQWGHKRIFLAAFAVLPIRGLLYTVSSSAPWLIAVQLLDGIGTGIYSALMPVVVAALMRGTGRFNLAQGFVTTTMGVGAAVSSYLGGALHDAVGYDATWVCLAAIACAGFGLFALAMPETSGTARASSGERRSRALSAHSFTGGPDHGRPDDRQPVPGAAAAIAEHGAGAADARQQAPGGGR